MTASPGARPALLLDRDGTLIVDRGYLRDPAGVRLLPGAAAALARAREAGLLLILVTNQSGVARGLMSEADVATVHGALQRRLARRGAALDAIYVCPHHPSLGKPPYRFRCPCRKPEPGLLLAAAREHRLDLSRSFMVGDRELDVAAGRAAGCRTVLVDRRGRRGLAAPPPSQRDHVAASLAAGISWILEQT